MTSVAEWAAACPATNEPHETLEIQAYTFAFATGAPWEVVTRPYTTPEASQSTHSWVGSGVQASVAESVSTLARGRIGRIETSRNSACLIVPERLADRQGLHSRLPSRPAATSSGCGA